MADEIEKNQISNEERQISPVSNRFNQDRVPPISKKELDFLTLIGVIIGITGLIAGFYTISNAPKYAYSAADKALTTTAYIWGISEIAGGLIIGFVLYVIANIGHAIVDLWEDKSK